MPEMTKPAVEISRGKEFLANDWKAFEKNTLKGFVTILLPSGLCIRECSVHEKNGNRWIGLPGKPWNRKDGTTTYIPIIDFANDGARVRFQNLALAAINNLLEGAQ